MSIFAISDPHLGFGVDKPMNKFGGHWQDHEARLADNWCQMVGSGDTVLVPGDISWSMQLDDALPDLRFLDSLPGRKVLFRGNHDFWWASLSKMAQFCSSEHLDSLVFMRHNGLAVPPDAVVCGTRGWILPDDPLFAAADRKIYEREAGRLRLSLEAATALRGPGQRLIVCLHFPPFSAEGKASLFTQLLEEYRADCCVYGHIHSIRPDGQPPAFPGPVDYRLVSADFLEFKPLRLASNTSAG